MSARLLQKLADALKIKTVNTKMKFVCLIFKNKKDENNKTMFRVP